MAQVVVPPQLISLLSTWGADRDAVEQAAADLVARYGEPHRRYHTLEHIDEMLAVADRLEATDEVTGAVWFHDAIYDPSRADNEARSAVLRAQVARRRSARPPSFAGEVARLVETTAQHEPDDERSERPSARRRRPRDPRRATRSLRALRRATCAPSTHT